MHTGEPALGFPGQPEYEEDANFDSVMGMLRPQPSGSPMAPGGVCRPFISFVLSCSLSDGSATHPCQ